MLYINNSMESVLHSLLASSLLVGLPSIVLVIVLIYMSIGIFRKKFTSNNSLPPIINIYITKCIYSITFYWDKIIPQLKHLRITHDFIVFQCITVVFILKLIDQLTDSPKSIKELSKNLNTSERNLSKLLNVLTIEGLFSYSEKSGKYQNNKYKKIKRPISNHTSNHNSTKDSDFDRLQSSKNHVNHSNKSESNQNGNGATLTSRFFKKPSSGLSTSPLSNSSIPPTTNIPMDKDCFFLDEYIPNDFEFQDPNNCCSVVSILEYPTFMESWKKLKSYVQSNPIHEFQIKHATFFQYIDENEYFLKKIFDCSVSQKNQLFQLNQQIAKTFNFSSYQSICDVGGGVGYLSFEIVRLHPRSKITILELEETMKNGIELAMMDASKRVYLQKDQVKFKFGDIFQSSNIPSAHLYLLMQVLRNWNHQEAFQILNSISTAMRRDMESYLSNPTAKPPTLLVIDVIQDENNLFKHDQLFKSMATVDLVMSTVIAGEDRTLKQWEILFKESNLNLIRIMKPTPYLSIMELTII